MSGQSGLSQAAASRSDPEASWAGPRPSEPGRTEPSCASLGPQAQFVVVRSILEIAVSFTQNDTFPKSRILGGKAEPSRARPSRAEASRAKPEPGRAEPGWDEQRFGEPGRGEPERKRAGRGPSPAEQSGGGQGQAGQNQAKPSLSGTRSLYLFLCVTFKNTYAGRRP